MSNETPSSDTEWMPAMVVVTLNRQSIVPFAVRSVIKYADGTGVDFFGQGNTIGEAFDFFIAAMRAYYNKQDPQRQADFVESLNARVR